LGSQNGPGKAGDPNSNKAKNKKEKKGGFQSSN
jgi:hypothetical protein